MTYDPMNPEYKTLWIDYLRGAQYLQGYRHLISGSWRGTHHSALGVLCEAVKHKVGGRWNGQSFESGYGIDAHIYLCGLTGFVGLSGRAESRVKDMNDEFGCSFKEIASWIEKNL